MVKFLTLSSCCCFDLRTGGLVIGYIELVFQALNLVSRIRHVLSIGYFLSLAIMVAYVCWVYGVHKNLLPLMIPSLVLSFVALILFAIPTTLLPIISMVWCQQICRALAEYMDKNEDQIKDIYIGIMLSMWVMLAVVTALSWLFTSVKYSLYMAMKGTPNGTRQFNV